VQRNYVTHTRVLTGNVSENKLPLKIKRRFLFHGSAAEYSFSYNATFIQTVETNLKGQHLSYKIKDSYNLFERRTIILSL